MFSEEILISNYKEDSFINEYKYNNIEKHEKQDYQNKVIMTTANDDDMNTTMSLPKIEIKQTKKDKKDKKAKKLKVKFNHDIDIVEIDNYKKYNKVHTKTEIMIEGLIPDLGINCGQSSCIIM